MPSSPAFSQTHPITLCLFVAFALAVAPEPCVAQSTAPYDALTNTRVEVTNFNPEPFTGLAFDPAGRLWAVSPYANAIVRYDELMTPNAGTLFATGLAPVSIAAWTTNGPKPELQILVACTGTHALFAHDPSDGRILAILRLDAEPADMVVDADNARAFITCQGDNTVVEVDLPSFQITRRYAVDCGARPGPLYLDRGVLDDASDNRVYVAPAITGNNSVPIPPDPSPNPFDPALAFKAAGEIRDLDGNAAHNQLPDHDLFRIDPELGTIAPVVRRLGSLIFDVERNPHTGELWVLSTDSHNKDPLLDIEPKLRGKFVTNQLVRVPGVNATSTLLDAHASLDLDDLVPALIGGQYNAARSLNQARTLEFLSLGAYVGYAFVASAQSDLIVALDVNGRRLREIRLPRRAQCYDLCVTPLKPRLLAALCLGSRTVEIFNWGKVGAERVNTLQLGFDPTPDQIRRGRDVFLDGQRSKDGRFSCASCHPRGMTDLLDWPLRGNPADEKDIMLTQSLMSIADTFPHHWRGERDLMDFQKAFPGLLGAAPDKVPSASEMRDLVVFFQSLQAPANPIQNPRRVLDDALGTLELPAPALGMASSAVQGQIDFQVPVSFNQKSCSECHSLQSGSDGSQMTEGTFLRAPRSMAIEMAHLRQLYLRSSKVVTLDPNDGADPRTFNQNGFGTFHDGRFPSMLHFVFDNFDTMPAEERVNTFRFVEQFDQGIAPAVHWAERYVQGSSAAVETDIAEILLAGAALDKRWNDVVAIGRFNTGSGWRPMQWVYRPEVGRFAPSVPGVASLNWTQMKNLTQAGLAENIFIGVPHRNGRRIGIDFDNDGLINGREAELGTNALDPDTDRDGWPDGYESANGDDPLVPQTLSSDRDRPALAEAELDFANSRLAKYHVRFGEPVKYEVTYSTPGGPVRTFTRDYFSMADTFVLTHEEPSTERIPFILHDPVFNEFDVDIVLTDRNGLTRGPIHLASFRPDFVHSRDNGGTGFNLHVASMAWTRSERLQATPNAAITLDAEVRIKLDYNYGAPLFTLLDDFESPPKSGVFPLRAQNKMVFCSVAVRRAGAADFEKSTNFVTPLATEFNVRLSPPRTEELDYQVDPGKPWICSPLTDATETTTISFLQPNLFPGDEVKLSVMGVLTPIAGSDPMVFSEASLQELQPLLLEDSMELTLQL